MRPQHEPELELELEDEGMFEDEFEASHFGLGEFELEGHQEGVHHEGAHHEGHNEALHEAIHEGLHEGLNEMHHESHESHESGFHESAQHEYFGETAHEGHPEGQQFIGKLARRFRGIARGVGRFVRTAAPVLRVIAKQVAPLIATAVGGPAAGLAACAISSQLESEDELELSHEFETHHEHHELGAAHEFEFEDELAHELENEDEFEVAHEAHPEAPLSQHELLAEMMAGAAAQAQTESEAEAMVGAAAMSILTPRDRRALRALLPHLVRGVAVITRILRRRRITRPAVRVVPTILARTTSVLGRRIAAGRPVTRAIAGRVMATQTRRVLSNPTTCGAAIVRNLRAAQLRGSPGGRPTEINRPAQGSGGSATCPLIASLMIKLDRSRART